MLLAVFFTAILSAAEHPIPTASQDTKTKVSSALIAINNEIVLMQTAFDLALKEFAYSRADGKMGDQSPNFEKVEQARAYFMMSAEKSLKKNGSLEFENFDAYLASLKK